MSTACGPSDHSAVDPLDDLVWIHVVADHLHQAERPGLRRQMAHDVPVHREVQILVPVRRFEAVMDAYGPASDVLRIANLAADTLGVAFVHPDADQIVHVVVSDLVEKVLGRPSMVHDDPGPLLQHEHQQQDQISVLRQVVQVAAVHLDGDRQPGADRQPHMGYKTRPHMSRSKGLDISRSDGTTGGLSSPRSTGPGGKGPLDRLAGDCVAVAQLLPDEDGAQKGSVLVHGAASVQLIHAHELDDIA